MRRVLFLCFGRPIHSYPAMLYLGIVLGIYAQLIAALALGLDVATVLTATLVLLTTALVGARLLYVAGNWSAYRTRLPQILTFSTGGASMYGGLLLAVPFSFPLLAAFEIPFGTYWDITAFMLLVGMIVTRIGCFLNGCCAGRPTAGGWGIHLPNHKGVWQRRFPTQMLEAGWGAIVLIGAVLLWDRLSFDGALFIYALGAYGAGRIVLEPMREEQDRLLGMNVPKAISTGFVVISFCAFAASWWR